MGHCASGFWSIAKIHICYAQSSFYVLYVLYIKPFVFFRAQKVKKVLFYGLYVLLYLCQKKVMGASMEIIEVLYYSCLEFYGQSICHFDVEFHKESNETKTNA